MTNTRTRVPQDLDRNLALDLVRVTEAAAMAAGRWVGRGDKEGGDGAAVDAMRKLINSIPMRGVVVIGEGEKDNAPMLFNGEQVGDWHRARGGRRGRPDRRHHADEQGHAERARRARGRRAGRDVRPERRLLHGEARGRPGLRRRDRHRRRRGREPAPHRQGQALRASPRSPSASWTGRATTTWSSEIRRTGRRHPVHLRRRHRRRDQRRPRASPTWTC